MPVDPKKMKTYMTVLGLVVIGLLSTVYLVKRAKNKSDVANLMAIAGMAGAKVYALELTPALQEAVDKAPSDPVGFSGTLEKALEGKVREHAEKKRIYSDPKSAAAMAEFEACYAYSVRILVLKKWKPGTGKDEIAKVYYDNVKALTAKYDFKNNTEAFLGFK